MELVETSSMGGIKCDNPLCDYKDMTVRFSDYPAYVNRPCPCCGQNLLTQEDYKSITRIHNFICFINKLGSKLPKPIKQYLNRQPVKEITLDWDGSGHITYSSKDQSPEK